MNVFPSILRPGCTRSFMSRCALERTVSSFGLFESCIGTKRLFCTEEDGLLHRSFFQRQKNKEVLSVELQEKGYVVGMKNERLLTESACKEVRKRMTNMFHHGIFETGIYPDEWHWREGLSKENVTREICNAWKSDTFIASIVLHPFIGQFICDIMGWNSIRLAQDDLLWKPPQTSASFVGFHQDSTYISKQFQPYPNNSVTLWIALDDATTETGCLEYIPHSHTPEWDNHHIQSSFHNVSQSYDMQHHNGSSQCVEVKEGCALLHHQDVWHGSKPNQSIHQHRRALVIHYLRGDVKFTTTQDITYIYGRYKRHDSIDLDEQFFPIIYGNNHQRSSWLNDYIPTSQ